MGGWEVVNDEETGALKYFMKKGETEDLNEYRFDYPGEGREPGNEEAIAAWEKEEARRERMEKRAAEDEEEEEGEEGGEEGHL